MGYTTDFNGQFKLDQPLTADQRAYLTAFSGTRRFKRNAEVTSTFPDPVREAVGLPVGDDGGYYVGDTENYGQNRKSDCAGYNNPPEGQPSLWCNWTPTEDGTAIVWNEGEKFYHYTEWLKYIIEHFLQPWGRVLNGEVKWQGEDYEDRGIIYVKDNMVKAVDDEIHSPPPNWD